MGDANGKGAFTHTSWNDYEIVAAKSLRQRCAEDLRPHPVLRAVHRPAARPDRHERGRGPEERQEILAGRCR